MDLKKQLGALYASTFLSGLRLTDAVWVALLAARGFALWEIGLAEAVYHIISLVFEVPSGMAADLLGRRRTYLLGGLLALAQDVTMLLANDLPMVCLAMGLGALSGSMYSGTSSALVYDSLVQTHCTERYLSVSARLDQLGLAAGGLGAVISAAQPLLGYTGLYLSSGACNALSAAADIFLTEPVVTQAQAQRDSFALRQLPKRFFRQAQQSLAALRQCPAAIRVILAAGLACSSVICAAPAKSDGGICRLCFGLSPSGQETDKTLHHQCRIVRTGHGAGGSGRNSGGFGGSCIGTGSAVCLDAPCRPSDERILSQRSESDTGQCG